MLRPQDITCRSITPPFRVPAERGGKKLLSPFANIPRVKYHVQVPGDVVIDLPFRTNQPENAINRWLGLRTASTNQRIGKGAGRPLLHNPTSSIPRNLTDYSALKIFIKLHQSIM